MSTDKTIEAELDKILNAPPSYWLQSAGMTGAKRFEIYALLVALTKRAQREVLESLFNPDMGIMGSHYIYLTDGAADEIAKELRARIAAHLADKNQAIVAALMELRDKGAADRYSGMDYQYAIDQLLAKYKEQSNGA